MYVELFHALGLLVYHVRYPVVLRRVLSFTLQSCGFEILLS